MRLDVNRLQHLRQIHRDRKAAFRAADDDRADQREKLRELERERQRIEHAYGPNREAEALDALARRIEAVKADLAAMDDRTNELAAASSTAGRTSQRALAFAQAEGLDLPSDLQPRAFGSAARGEQGVATWGD